MNPSVFDQAARELATRRARGLRGERLPVALRPQSLDQGFAVQGRVTELLGELRGDRPIGWKCALPPAGKIVVAPLYGRELYHSGLAAPVTLVAPARLEPELAFVLGRDLPAQLARDQGAIGAAIGEVRMAVELIGCRYDNPDACDFPELLADGLFNQGLILGPVLARAPALAAERIAIAVQSGGETRAFDGKHANGLPVNPLYWLAEFLHDHNLSLRAGDVIITGSYAGVLELPLDSPITLSYANLGQMTFHCLAR